jgi:hypothetical protein
VGRTIAILVFGVLSGCSSRDAEEARTPVVTGVRDLGIVANPAGAKFIRDGATSGLVGGRILYAFGDTLFFERAVDGANYRSNTAAYAELGRPIVLSEPLDAKGLPQQFIPFTDDERDYNDASGRPDERIALWPGTLIPRATGNALVFFNKLKVHPGLLNYEDIGTGIAEVGPGQTVAKRLPGLLFTAPEPNFIHAAVPRDGFVYVYACQTSGACRIARAPLERAMERSSYSYWDGAAWVPELARAQPVVPGSTSGFSVTYNDHLRSYLAFFSRAFGKAVELRVAPRPEGPWSDPVQVYQFPSAIYATHQHEALDADGGRRVFVSAFRDLGNFRGEIKLLEISFE